MRPERRRLVGWTLWKGMQLVAKVASPWPALVRILVHGTNVTNNSNIHAWQARLDNLFSLTRKRPTRACQWPVASTDACKVVVKVPDCLRLIPTGGLVAAKC